MRKQGVKGVDVIVIFSVDIVEPKADDDKIGVIGKYISLHTIHRALCGNAANARIDQVDGGIGAHCRKHFFSRLQ